MKINLTIGIPVWLDFIFTCPLLAYRLLRYGYTYRRIYLGEDEWTILDQQDYYRFGNLKWTISGNGKKFYATRFLKIAPGKTKTLSLHRAIMNAPKGLVVDHINGESLDNRRANLRLATQSQNSCNKRKRKNTSSQFRGVSFYKPQGVWNAYINVAGKRIQLGYFDSEIEAAKAYDAAARKYHGEFARLNFPEEVESVQGRQKV
ncbi:MAG: HNH endonuclease [Sedimentisphaerales bacterium]